MIKNIKNKIYKLLKWTEKWTKTDMIYLAKGGFWVMLGKIILNIVGIISSVIFANFLPSENYGTYKFILSITGILAIFSLPGVGGSLVRSIARGYEGDIKRSIKIKLKWGFVGGIIGIIISFYYFFQGNIIISKGFLIASLLMPIMNATGIIGLFMGRKMFKEAIVFSTSKKIFSIILSIITVLLTNNIFIILIVYFLSKIIANIFSLIIIFKKYKPNKKTEPRTIAYGKHLSYMNIISTIIGKIDKIMIFHFLGATKLAIYSFAQLMPSQIKSMLVSISGLATIKFSSNKAEIIKKTLNKKIFKLMLFLIPTTILYIIFAPNIFKLFFPNYLDSILFSQLFSLIIILSPQNFLIGFLKSQAKQKELYIINTITPIVRLCFYTLIIPFGILGAISAYLISQTLNFILLIYFFKKV